MFIREVHMDGFKSYPERTSIRGLDRCFSAITGMNGSGKSNIVDAIVFALDLTAARLLRVNSLRELVNIRRKECTVTVVLDNQDKGASPAGYETYDAIEISRSLDLEGRSKYKMNGHSCTRGSVEKFCKSAGITDDFIVLQGHITKVINMRSGELKGMIEEAAGTRCYYAEKERAAQLLGKKEAKLREARACLQKNISPFLNELLREKQIYVENRDFERKRTALVEEMDGLEKALSTAEAGQRVAELREQLREYAAEKTELADVEEKLAGLNGEAVETDLIELKTRIEEERLRLKETGAERELESREAELRQLPAVSASEQDRKQHRQQLLDREAILARELCDGFSSSKMTELESLRSALQSLTAEHRRLLSGLSGQPLGLGDEISAASVRAEADRVGRSIGESSRAASQYGAAEQRLQSLRSRISYPLRPGVFGTVDENFETVDDRHREAIHTILGGRAKFVICETDAIASELLQSSDRKISCMPLNKIVSYPSPSIPSVTSALDAILYDKQYDKAFRNIFGGFYICEDKQTAARVCSDHRVVCVTTDGTVYDPKGTLTGGKAAHRQEVVRRRDIESAEAELAEIGAKILDQEALQGLVRAKAALDRLGQLTEEIASASGTAALLESLCGSKIDIRKELQELRSQILQASAEEKSHTQLAEKRARLESDIATLRARVHSDSQQAEEASARLEKYLDRLRETELQDSHRKLSLRMLEGLETRKRHLLRSTLKRASQLEKLAAWLREHSSSIPAADTPAAATGQDALLLSELNIPSEWLHCQPTPSSTSPIEARLSAIRSELSVGRQRTTMDPASFELLEKNLAQIKEIEEKIHKLETDRESILRTIDTLSELGREESQKAFHHINNSLSRFLGYFIQGATVSITHSFEIEVTIASYKKHLSELSGGQRSLIALCLIFSVLTYSPAPFYIFDEIDAALDLNYTQGIGEIIQNEFKSAQFIVVSLKSNMFENANRIFRVFVQDERPKVCQVK